ncbi:MAG: hypothetical protein PF450_01235 [Bacteroidales bacterium]|jgi:DNA repair exonuclease SbcCD ATPase subunit|nr:hypothetical protein [Bacteroidales bacterium]
MNKTKKRLSQIQSSIEWQDYEMVQAQLALLAAESNPIVLSIVKKIENQHYLQAQEEIRAYLAPLSDSEIIVYEDKELGLLKDQLKELEQVVESIAEQRDEQLFLIQEFGTHLQLAMGPLVKAILKKQTIIAQEKLLQKQASLAAVKSAYELEKSEIENLKSQRQKLEESIASLDEFDPEFDELEDELESVNNAIREQQKKVREQRQKVKDEQDSLEDKSEEAYEEAQQEYQEYEYTYEKAKEDKVAQLDKEDVTLLKKLYRKATRLCHPDTVTDELQAQATEMMTQLNQARDQGDLNAIKALLKRLENGIAFLSASDQLTDREQIERKLEELLTKLEEISDEVELLNDSETWTLLSGLKSWDAHFEEQQAALKIYMHDLEKEYETLMNPQSKPKVDPLSKETLDTVNTTTLNTSVPKAHHAKDEYYWNEDF